MSENPQAFPLRARSNGSIMERSHEGMTLLDYFAGQALAVAWDARDKGYYEGDDADMAKCAYQIAQAMLDEREGRK